MPIRHVEPPRLGRSVLFQLLAIAAGALASEHPWARHEVRPEPPPEPPRKEERRIRVVRVDPPKPVRKEPPPPAATPPAPSAPQQAEARKPPSPKPIAAQRQQPLARIAADSTAIHGVRMRVLVPREPAGLAAHLRNSGGCLVVSRLSGGSAEVVSVLGLDGLHALDQSGPPCNGVPRLLKDASLNEALGDPVGRARAAHPGEDIVLQVLLTPRLQDAAQAALHQRFGAVSEEETSRRAAEAGYELTCFAEPAGAVRCQ